MRKATETIEKLLARRRTIEARRMYNRETVTRHVVEVYPNGVARVHHLDSDGEMLGDVFEPLELHEQIRGSASLFAVNQTWTPEALRMAVEMEAGA